MSLFNKLIITFLPLIPKPIVGMVSKRYVAGAKLDDAVKTVKNLNAQGIMATLDVLGESAKQKDECTAAVMEYFQVLETIVQEKLDCNISLKPTQLGLSLDKELCYENIRQIVQKAAQLKVFVRIDMEDSNCTTNTIEIFSRLHQEFKNVGIVLQAYLRRSLNDLKKLSQYGANFRLCKGIYVEKRQIAYKDAWIVNQNFALLMECGFKAKSYLGIATHDEKVVWEGLRLIEQLQLGRNDYEFQMLLGVDEELRKILIDAGHRLRVYVPYGAQWYAYCIRRLKENPKIAIYVMKAMVGLR